MKTSDKDEVREEEDEEGGEQKEGKEEAKRLDAGPDLEDPSFHSAQGDDVEVQQQPPSTYQRLTRLQLTGISAATATQFWSDADRVATSAAEIVDVRNWRCMCISASMSLAVYCTIPILIVLVILFWLAANIRWWEDNEDI
jgi:hypothetical protein